jgi:hypothetical protein
MLLEFRNVIIQLLSNVWVAVLRDPEKDFSPVGLKGGRQDYPEEEADRKDVGILL